MSGRNVLVERRFWRTILISYKPTSVWQLFLSIYYCILTNKEYISSNLSDFLWLQIVAQYQMRIDHIRFLVVGLKLQHVTKVWRRLCISLPPFPCIYNQSPKDLVTPYSSVKLKQWYRGTEGSSSGGDCKSPQVWYYVRLKYVAITTVFLQPSPQVLLSALAYSGGYCGRWLLLKRTSCRIPLGSLHFKLVLVQSQDYKCGVLAEERSWNFNKNVYRCRQF